VDPAIRVGWEVILSITVFTLVVVAFLLTMVVRAHRAQVRTGIEGLVHERGVARTQLAPRGKVFVHGEIWDAVAEEPIEPDTPVEVIGVDGMRLRVRPEA
jgi:membrane-bound serine protease (ClpP class)